MSSAEIIKIYTSDLLLGRNPAKALERLYTVGTTIKPFEDAGTEELLARYDSDWACRRPLKMLRDKFAVLKRAKRIQEQIFKPEAVMEKQKVEQAMSQESTNSLFSDALKQVSTVKSQVKRVDYSKFKIVKKSKKTSKPHLETPKIRSDRSQLRTFSFTSSVCSWSSGSSENSPDYQ